MIERNDDGLDQETIEAQWKNCECGKRSYSSHDQAKEACRFLGSRIRVYRCHLNQWSLHVTNKDKELYRQFFDQAKQRVKYKRAVNKWSAKDDE